MLPNGLKYYVRANKQPAKRAELRLPPLNVSPQLQIPLTRRAELKENPVCLSTHLVQVGIDGLTKSKAPANFVSNIS